MLSENRNLNEREAQDLFKQEEMIWDNYEEELKNLIVEKQTKIVNQVNQLNSYISDVMTVAIPSRGPGLSNEQYIQLGLDRSTVTEIVTEEGIYLLLEDGNTIGPYLGA
jgi:hypothetical protein|tara:strand:+ start:223 stop:549 length:327 start_codon:yes stop_codon:yes gene_type:complete